MLGIIKLWMSSDGGIIELLVMRVVHPSGALSHVPDTTFSTLRVLLSY